MPAHTPERGIHAWAFVSDSVSFPDRSLGINWIYPGFCGGGAQLRALVEVISAAQQSSDLYK